jgi:hypothetical protein
LLRDCRAKGQGLYYSYGRAAPALSRLRGHGQQQVLCDGRLSSENPPHRKLHICLLVFSEGHCNPQKKYHNSFADKHWHVPHQHTLASNKNVMVLWVEKVYRNSDTSLY